MIAALVFDFADALRWGPPVMVALVAWTVWSLRRRGLGWGRVSALAGLRLLLLGLLVFLLARPTWITREDPAEARRPVKVLLDRSESMALEDGGNARYQRALDFLRDQLLPALKSRGCRSRPSCSRRMPSRRTGRDSWRQSPTANEPTWAARSRNPSAPPRSRPLR